MRRQLLAHVLLLSLLLPTLSAYAEEGFKVERLPVEISVDRGNFPDAIFLDIVSDFDTDNSGGLSATELAAVETLELSGEGFSNLSGLGHFTAIEALNCAGIALSTLDLRHNSALKNLNCSGSALKEVSLPFGMKGISSGAFRDCRSLASVTIPAELTAVDEDAFLNCDSLTDLNYSGTVSQWRAISVGENNDPFVFATVHFTNTNASFDVAFNTYSGSVPPTQRIVAGHKVVAPAAPDREELWFVGWFTDVALTAPFDFRKPVTEDLTLYAKWVTPGLALPASLAAIGKEAFAGGAFTYVKLPERAVSIGWHAFADCPNLAYIYIPPQTAEIDAEAFENVQGLTIIGKSGTSAEAYARHHGCKFIFIP